MDFGEYEQYRETKLHEVPGFSYNTYLCTIPLDFERVAPHWHDQMEIIYVKRGSGTVTVDFSHHAVCAGSIVPVMPGEIHAITGPSNGRMEYENIIFSLSILDSQERDDWARAHVLDPLRNAQLHFKRPLTPADGQFYERVRWALDEADAACETAEPSYSLVVRSHLLMLIDALYTFRDSDAPQPKKRSTERLKAVLEAVRLHYTEPMTVDDAAKLSGYSKAHLMRVFKEETGQTFTKYLADYRLSAAAFYLEKTDDAVSHIAGNCGFQNLSYFNRCFRNRYAMTPTQFRKARRG